MRKRRETEDRRIDLWRNRQTMAYTAESATMWNNSASGTCTSSTCRGVFKRQKCAMVQRHLCGCGEQQKFYSNSVVNLSDSGLRSKCGCDSAFVIVPR
jgi:hypothetical protein